MPAYINQHGWVYRVMERVGKYRARYQIPGNKTWWGSNHVIPKETEEEAEADLCRVAKNARVEGCERMKAITLWQPWASLLACGAKQFETRSWPTKHRGPIAIHAAKTSVSSILNRMFPLNVKSYYSFVQAAGKSLGTRFDVLPLGSIIAVGDLVGCYKMVLHGGRGLSSDSPGWIETESGIYLPDEQEMLFGDWTPGRYAWEFANVRMYPEPISAKGMQGLWEWRGWVK